MTHLLTLAIEQSQLVVSQFPLAINQVARERVDTGQMFLWLGAAAGAIAVVCGIMFAINRVVQRHRKYSHTGLFNGLCKAHKLDRSDKSLLKQLAKFYRMSQPARLFVEPGWLEPARLGPNYRSQAGKVKELRTALFGKID